jgi:hypothetical protein
MALTLPNTFAESTGTLNLNKLDQNFNYLKQNLENSITGIVFDGGTPTSTYTSTPNLDCGGVT